MGGRAAAEPVSPPAAMRTPTRRGSATGSSAAQQGPASRTQALKDLKLTIEYKHLKQNSPGGVLVVPSFEDLRIWNGVIFVRKGLYQDGIFKFVITIPAEYNDRNVWPEVRFVSEVVNPYVNPQTGILDLRSNFPQWDPNSHFMVSVLTFLKKIFYLKDSDVADYRKPANPEALRMFMRDRAQYRQRVEELVATSQSTVYENPHESPLAFSQPQAAHDQVRQTLLETEDLTVKSWEQVLDACKRASDLS